MKSVDTVLRGRREAALLELPSVRRMANVLAKRCREPSWVRTTVAALDRFATLTGNDDLEALLVRAKHDPHQATAAIAAFASALANATGPQIAALAMAPKLWFTFNGVPVAWDARRDHATGKRVSLPTVSALERLILLALIGSGLRRAELLRVKLGDVGELNSDGALTPNLEADPLAVRFVTARGREYVTFLSDQARTALVADIARRRDAGEQLDPQTPLVASPGGSAETARTVARAGRINASLIDAGNALNVDLCRTTGDFFRTWGMPGARFAAAHPGVEETV